MKKFLLIVLLMISAAAYAQERNTSLETGSNHLPVSMDRLPPFPHPGKVDYIELWVFYEESLVNISKYSKQLQANGFEYDGYYYVKGNAVCNISDSLITFKVSGIGRPVRAPAEIMKFFPRFEMRDYGLMYAVDIDIQYKIILPRRVLESYIRTLKTAGFTYKSDYDEYTLDTGGKAYYFKIDNPDMLVWSVLYY